jgi:hypothetical protein
MKERERERERESNSINQSTYYLDEKNDFIKSKGALGDKKLKISSVPNGILQAENGLGVFYENLSPLEIGKISTGNNREFPKRYDREKYKNEKIDFIDEKIVFGGIIGIYGGHFGHFLIETMNRIWVYLDDKYKDTKIVFLNESKRETRYTDFFTLFGLKKENIIILKKDTKFKNILIPEVSFHYEDAWCSFEYADIFEKIRQNVPNKYNFEKIYLTRVGEKNNAVSVYGEEKIQNIFRKNGFEIIRPTDYSVMDQMSLIKNCKVLAGCSGTALHWALCMEGGSTVICLNRDVSRTGTICQQCINEVKRHNSIYIDAYMIADDFGHYTSMVGMTKQLKRFFDDNNFKYDVEDMIIDGDELVKTVRKYSEFKMTESRKLEPIHYFKLFNLINIVKMLSYEVAKKKVYLLGVPFIKIKIIEENIKDVYLFHFIPIVRIKSFGFEKRFYLFRIIYVLRFV